MHVGCSLIHPSLVALVTLVEPRPFIKPHVPLLFYSVHLFQPSLSRLLKEHQPCRRANISKLRQIMDPATPNAPFKWESASGLGTCICRLLEWTVEAQADITVLGSEHSCFSCAMKMSNPKARQTCYGIHSIPCYRYHQTMHAIGTSHNCFACIQADELHENRHRRVGDTA